MLSLIRWTTIILNVFVLFLLFCVYYFSLLDTLLSIKTSVSLLVLFLFYPLNFLSSLEGRVYVLLSIHPLWVFSSYFLTWISFSYVLPSFKNSSLFVLDLIPFPFMAHRAPIGLWPTSGAPQRRDTRRALIAKLFKEGPPSSAMGETLCHGGGRLNTRAHGVEPIYKP